MFQFQDIWFPDGEKHFPEWMAKSGELVDGKGTYQIKKWRACLPWIKNWRTSVDVGAHVGLWSMQMAPKFYRLEAFEPVELFRECWRKNMEEQLREHEASGHVCPIELNQCALGAEAANVMMKIPLLNGGIDSGGTHVYCGNKAPGSRGDGDELVQMITLDSCELRDVDFIKLDAEGYELEILRGAKETLRRWEPCVIVEQKAHKLGPNFGIKGTPAVDYLRVMGAELRQAISGDYILSWP